MVTNKGIEVHIVSSSDGHQLVEYDNPKANASNDEHLSEKFIEAITGLAYHVEVKVKPGFELYAADGIRVRTRIDGGVVSQYRYFGRDEVEEMQRTGSRVIDSSAIFLKGQIWHRITYSFGSLKIDDDPETIDGFPDQQASDLGCIEVSVMRATRRKLSEPVEKKESYTPLPSPEVTRNLVEMYNISHVVVPGKIEQIPRPGMRIWTYEDNTGRNCEPLRFFFYYRSRMHLQLLGIIPQSPVLTPAEPETNEVREATTDDQTTLAISSLKPFQETTRQAIKIEDGEQTRLSQRSFSEYARLKALEKETWELQEQAIQALKRENRELHEQLLRLNADRQALKQESQKLHEQVRRLNADLSEYKSLGERMTAVLQSLPNNKTTTASMLPVVPAATSESTITPSGPLPESDSIKRERIKEEDDEVHTLTATIRTSKRSKVIDLTLD